MKEIDMNKHIWEGWTVGDFIERLEPEVDRIMNGESITKPFRDKTELTNWCRSNQPYYKKTIREVITYFARKYNIGKGEV